MSDVVLNSKNVVLDKNQYAFFAKEYGVALANGESVEEFNQRMKEADIVPPDYPDSKMLGRCNNFVDKARKLGHKIAPLRKKSGNAKAEQDDMLSQIISTYSENDES